MGFQIPFRIGIVAGLLGVMAGCDAGPGPSVAGERPPVVSALALTPRLVDLNATGSPYVIQEGVVTVPLTVQVEASDPEGEVAEVVFVVESPYAGREAVATGPLQAVGEGVYGGAADLEIPAAEVGRYSVVVYAVDEAGRLSNQVRSAVELRNTGSPPVVESVEATVEEDAVVLVATVADPDGLANVAQAEARSSTGTLTLLRDDGDPLFSGDDEAGDGRFSGRARLEAGATDTLSFSVQALDRSGLHSAAVVREVEVD